MERYEGGTGGWDLLEGSGALRAFLCAGTRQLDLGAHLYGTHEGARAARRHVLRQGVAHEDSHATLSPQPCHAAQGSEAAHKEAA